LRNLDEEEAKRNRSRLLFVPCNECHEEYEKRPKSGEQRDEPEQA